MATWQVKITEERYYFLTVEAGTAAEAATILGNQVRDGIVTPDGPSIVADVHVRRIKTNDPRRPQ